MRLYILILLVFLFSTCNGTSKNVNNAANSGSSSNTNRTNSNIASASVPVDTYEIVKTYKHDGEAFTQGLVVHNGFFYESTGEYGDSTVRKVEIETGRVLQKKDIAEDYFAEGLTILNDRVYQITWQEGTAFQYDMNFTLIKEFRYPGQGWG